MTKPRKPFSVFGCGLGPGRGSRPLHGSRRPHGPYVRLAAALALALTVASTSRALAQSVTAAESPPVTPHSTAAADSPAVLLPPVGTPPGSTAAGSERVAVPATALPHSRGMLAGIQAGTRTLTGEPGPRYWQQRVDYRIEAEVDFSLPELRGRETITYHNNSPDALDTLGLRLQQNVMKAESPRVYAMPITGGMKVSRLVVQGVEIPLSDTGRIRPEGGGFVGFSGTPELGTLAWVALPQPIPAGGTAEVQVDWSFRIPPEAAPRMGMQDSTTVQMAQWYPQIAVYDDLEGWDHQLYLGTGEFYYEYGDFDVTVRVPPGFVVAATGTLQNPADVLTAEGLERLERAARDPEPVRILSASEFGPGRILTAANQGRAANGSPAGAGNGGSEAAAADGGSEAAAADGGSEAAAADGGWRRPAATVAWRFRAEDVRDFAFAAGDHYQWDATRAVVDSAAGRTTLVHAVWRPDRPHADTAVRMAAHAIAFHSAHIAPYIYPQITVSDGGSGGMEYPMIVFVEAYGQTADRPDPARAMYSLIAHEIGHEWFPMMVGSNETAYGWQDEGLNTFRTIFAAEAHDGARATNRRDARAEYAALGGSDFEQPLMTHADAFPIVGDWYDLAAYAKPALVLLVLRDVVGPNLFDRTLTEYTRRWTLKHPAPQDFFNTFEQAAGSDLDWFWRPWFYETDVLDLAVGTVAGSPGGGHTITVVNRGAAPAPVVAEVGLADGGTVRLEAPAAELARMGSVALTLPPGRDPVSVRLDPEERYPDANRSNDSWNASVSAPAPSAAR